MDLVGLILNFTGALFLAYSVIENPAGAYQNVNGKNILLASILIRKFRLGIWLIIIGFMMQLIARFIY